VSEDDGGFGVERVEERDHVAAERHAVVPSVARRARRRVAAHARRDDAEPRLREHGHLVAERMRLVGKAVQAEDERAAAVVERLEGDRGRADRARGHGGRWSTSRARTHPRRRQRCGALVA
jgi:hypothetical protein